MGLLGSIGAALGAINPVGLLSTGSQLAGSVLGFVGQQQTNAQNQAIANQNNAAQASLAQQNINMETDFAQNGLSWKIADAAKNGISPLAAIGATDPSYSPVSEAFTAPSYTSPLSTLSAGIDSAGQNVSRALTQPQDPSVKASNALALAHQAKENDLLDVQIAGAKLELAAHSTAPGVPTQTPAFSWVTNSDGSSTMIPSYQTRDTPLGGAQWMINNKLIPGVEDLYQNVVGHGAYNLNPVQPLDAMSN